MPGSGRAAWEAVRGEVIAVAMTRVLMRVFIVSLLKSMMKEIN
jgi:hypothetical protein